MAWTTIDLATIEAAIASGTLRVQFADRMVQYHTVTELLKARDAIKQSISTTAGNATRCTYSSFSKG